MEEEKKKTRVIDLRVLFRKIIAERRRFYIVLSVVFVLSCIYILGVPRYYTTEAKLAPEIGSSMPSGSLGSIASSFGIELNDMQTNDAITPLLYPDLMEDNGFVSSLFRIKVVSKDGAISTDYFDYLKTKQQSNIWMVPVYWVKKYIKSLSSEKEQAEQQFSPYHLSMIENDIAEAIRGNIKLSTDKKTGVITIMTKAQDPLICCTLADSVQERLKAFITDYRTSKVRTDYEYYQNLTEQAWMEYQEVRHLYSRLSDASTNIRLKSAELRIEDVENDMQQKYTAYTTLNTQLQAARAKVQERTPVFTVIKGAAEPVKPSGPKRMFFVLGMLILAFLFTTVYIFKNEMKVMLAGE